MSHLIETSGFGIAGVVASSALLMMFVEWVRPGSALPRVKRWLPRALAASTVQALAVWCAGVAWEPWMASHRLWSTDELGTSISALLGYLAITFVYYGWHRARHEVGFLWRFVHQLHHSAQRIEVITSFYKHPTEIALNSVLSSVVLYLVAGVSPAAASIAVLLTGLAELFYHWNVRTPHWLGYLIQRPESHRVHHQRGVHHFNYSDLPLWDIVFGTFHNPHHESIETGFTPQQEQRVVEMLVGRDVVATHVEATS